MIPKISDFKSDVMTHKFGDLFNQPGLTNFLGSVQTEMDLVGIRNLNFPPFGTSDVVSGGLYIDNKYFPSTGTPINYTWFPNKIIRESSYKDLFLISTTSLIKGKMGVVVKLEITNRNRTKRNLKIRLGLIGSVTNTKDKWKNFITPKEDDNKIIIDKKRNLLIFKSIHTEAFQMQGMVPKANYIDNNNVSKNIKLKPNETKVIYYLNIVGKNENGVVELYDKISTDPNREIEISERDWNEELKAIFTPNNDRYSGSLPELQTTDTEILKLYHIGILGIVYFKRDNPYSVFGRAYETLMPKYWQTVTFIWDYALSSMVHAMLDPKVMRKYLEVWMLMDMHKHFGVEYLKGESVGTWYSVNDYAMNAMSKDYLRWSGDMNWLKKSPDDKNKQMKVIDYLEKYANSWEYFKTKNGLADYGGINNILECVSTYVHEVPSFNAANVYNLRFISELFELLGDDKKSKKYNKNAKKLLKEIMKLYSSGNGTWKSRMPNGKLNDVKHCYDFITILNTISADLSKKQINEMTEYFKDSLYSKTWMRALSPSDDNVMFSVRPDHQWNGAYPAWPAEAVTGLYKTGNSKLGFEYIKGLAKSTNQGPFAQAHFVEEVINPENGGARKAPSEYPYMCDWACAGGGAFVDVIIKSIFGIKPTLNNGISAKPKFEGFDPKAELINVPYQGKYFNVNKNGIIKN